MKIQVLASRRIKREKASVSPVDVCRTKTSLLKLPTKIIIVTHANKVIVGAVVVVAVATRVKH